MQIGGQPLNTSLHILLSVCNECAYGLTPSRPVTLGRGQIKTVEQGGVAICDSPRLNLQKSNMGQFRVQVGAGAKRRSPGRVAEAATRLRWHGYSVIDAIMRRPSEEGLLR